MKHMKVLSGVKQTIAFVFRTGLFLLRVMVRKGMKLVDITQKEAYKSNGLSFFMGKMLEKGIEKQINQLFAGKYKAALSRTVPCDVHNVPDSAVYTIFYVSDFLRSQGPDAGQCQLHRIRRERFRFFLPYRLLLWNFPLYR